MSSTTMELFAKVTRVEGCLEGLLQTLSRAGLQVIDMSAQPSLDMAFYFIRMHLEGAKEVPQLEKTLADLSSVRCVEVLAA